MSADITEAAELLRTMADTLADTAARLEQLAADSSLPPIAVEKGWDTQTVALLPEQCWVIRPGLGVWWCGLIAMHSDGSGDYQLALMRKGQVAQWRVPAGEAVRFRTDHPRPPYPTQPTLTTARSMSDELGDRARWLLDREPTDGEPLDVRS